MANLIPNENCWVGFVAGSGTSFGVANYAAPTAAELATAVDLTDYLMNLNATTQGNTVPTPRLRSLFETNIPGTVSSQFTGDFYRDDETDLAWDTLPRGTRGCFLVKRFGGTGADGKPAVGEDVEVWPIQVVARSAGGLQSGTAQMFTLTGSIPIEPVEDAVVAA